MIKSNIAIYCFVFVAFWRCTKQNYELESKSPVGIGSNNAFVLNSRYVSHSGNELFIETDIGVVFSGDAIDNVFIPDSAFLNDNFNSNQVKVQNIEIIQLQENLSYSNFILMDMSKDWNSIIDLMNLRTRALHKTVIETLEHSENEIALATYRRSENGNSQNFYHYRSDINAFKQSKEEYGQILLDWYYTSMGGTSSLYDALNLFLEYCNENSTHLNKNITIISRSIPDNQNTSNYLQIINKAQSMGIKINLIALGNDFNWNMVLMAQRTGGFVNIVSSTNDYTLTNGGIMDKGTPMLASIHRPLSKNLHVYRLNLQLIRNSGIWSSGATVFNYYQTNLLNNDGSNRLNNYLPIYVTIP